jgi:acyl-CoA thioesterase II
MFCASGRPGLPVRYTVERLSDGASTSVRGVRAEQGGRIVCAATASCRGPEPGFDHDDAIAADVLGPHMHADAKVLVQRDPAVWAGHPLEYVSRKGSIELRLVDAPRHFSDWPERRGGELLHVWVRSPGPLPADPFMHQCAVAYLTDYVLAHAPPLQLMSYHATKRMATASVNHALWFYRPFKADQWLLVEIACPVAGSGRGLATAKVYDTQRRVVAVTTQECSYREQEPHPATSIFPREIQPETNA